VKLRHLAVCAAAIALVPLFNGAGAGAGPSSAAGRQSRDSRMAIAGGDIFLWSSHASENSGNGCTMAFSVRSRSTGALGVITAGHCVATLPGGPAFMVHQTERLPGDDTAPGAYLGRVTRSNYRLGSDGDSAFIQLGGGRRAEPYVFTGGTRSSTAIPVAGLGQLQSGIQVCYSGATSGEHCGFTVEGPPEDVNFKSNGSQVTISHEWRATGADCTSRKGDSGSPVYIRSGGVAYAVGILSGGQVQPNSCPFYFTPIKLALQLYDVRLRTAS
jgi:V8-like Glu-specific endopeptidase